MNLNNILQRELKHIKNFLILFCLLLTGCHFSQAGSASTIRLKTPQGKELELTLARSDKEQSKGLSGVRENELNENQGMFFYYTKDDYRQFWMPDTYIDLGILFVDARLKIREITVLSSHPGWKEPIPRSGYIYCRHVIELKASSPLFKGLKVGQQLVWASPQPSP